MGVTTTTAAFLMIQRERKNSYVQFFYPVLSEEQNTSLYLPKRLRSTLALLIPLVFLADIACMLLFNLQGNNATALIGGSAICILMIVHFLVYKQKNLRKSLAILLMDSSSALRFSAPSSRLPLSSTLVTQALKPYWALHS